ncbi:MAG: aminotransferase class I/II-fold pyridoxal phosphate-dependent enzyme [Nitriliruptoraceae bacterium]
MTESVQYQIVGTDAASVTASIERGVVTGRLAPGEALPSVRALAQQLALSPTTVASAYRDLRQRGILVSHDRSRMTVAHRPALATRLVAEIPSGAVDLASGNPDPPLLPDLGPALTQVGPVHRLYGDELAVDSLVELARTAFRRDGVDHDWLAIVGGGLDGLERILEVHCRLGDKIAVEDPCYIGALDLIRTLGLEPVGVPIDEYGMIPDALNDALDDGCQAMLLVPRAQNPSGAAIDADRAHQLRAVVDRHDHVLVVEDDPAGPVSGADYFPIAPGRPRWAVVRSVAKSLGPDLRVAIIASDEDTHVRLLGRQRLGTGWVSHLLQYLTARVWQQSLVDGTLKRAASTYRQRRQTLIDELADVDIVAVGASGLNVWVPVIEEVPVVQGLAARGWAVQAGEPFRIESEPGIRITAASLDVAEAPRLAYDIADVFGHRLGTRRG